MRFEHRDPESSDLADQVWRTSSDAPGTMTSAARTCCQLVVTRFRGRVLAALRGPETGATTAPVPPEAEFLGIRLALGTVLRPYPATGLVDGHVAFPVTEPRGGRIHRRRRAVDHGRSGCGAARPFLTSAP